MPCSQGSRVGGDVRDRLLLLGSRGRPARMPCATNAPRGLVCSCAGMPAPDEVVDTSGVGVLREVFSPDDASTRFGIGLWVVGSALLAFFGDVSLGVFVALAGLAIWALCVAVLLIRSHRDRSVLWRAARYCFGSWANWI